MARVVLSGWVASENITGWYYGDGDWHMSTALSAWNGRPPEAVPSLLEPIDDLRPAMSVRRLGTQRFKDVVDRCPWGGLTGHKLFQLLTKLGEYPVGAMSHYKAFVGETSEGTETGQRMGRLMEMGLAEVVARNVRVTVDRLPRGVPADALG